MPTIDPIPQALVPADSAAADALGAPNYDEFQSDREVWELLRTRPLSVLRVTMPHCDVPTPEAISDDASEEALMIAAANMSRLAADPRVRRVRNLLWVYEITRRSHDDAPQIGLGGMARTDEIRTSENPRGSIIRNEGIRESKARGRAQLSRATHADMGTVNLAVDDTGGSFREILRTLAHAAPPTFETSDEEGNRHRVWLIQDRATIDRLRDCVGREALAYVADGNHRSAAAAMLGHDHYLAVFFPAATMTIAPYNRLLEDVGVVGVASGDLNAALRRSFDVEPYDGADAFQPTTTHEIGLYDGEVWWRLRPLPGTFDPNDAAQDIDADIVQRKVFAEIFGIADPRDERLTFVGANRGARWLQQRVDEGGFRYAITLPPVTMRQFVSVCRQNRIMPPKSTWFVPKIRSGLVMALTE